MEDIIICSVFGVLAIVLFFVGFVWRRIITTGCTMPVEGQIVEVKRTRSQSGKHLYHLTLGYEVNGQMYRSKALTNMGRRNPQEVQQLFVDPDNPVRQYRKKDLLMPDFLMLWGGCVFVILLGIIFTFIF